MFLKNKRNSLEWWFLFVYKIANTKRQCKVLQRLEIVSRWSCPSSKLQEELSARAGSGVKPVSWDIQRDYRPEREESSEVILYSAHLMCTICCSNSLLNREAGNITTDCLQESWSRSVPDFILNCLCYEISLWGENPPRSNETVKLVDVSKNIYCSRSCYNFAIFWTDKLFFSEFRGKVSVLKITF